MNEQGLKIMQAVARGWCHPANGQKEMDSDLAMAITVEVCAVVGVEPPQYGQAKVDPLPDPPFPNPDHDGAMAEWPKPIAPPQMVTDIAQASGGKVEEAFALPDGSGGAVVSFPLPQNHWLYGHDDKPIPGYSFTYNAPPMPFRMGTDDPRREEWASKIRLAARYAVRASTMDGKEEDFDPDAMVQNMVVGMLGYWTPDGLTDDDWANPQGMPAPTLYQNLRAMWLHWRARNKPDNRCVPVNVGADGVDSDHQPAAL